tara:strand:+ start:1840 stop:2346 length:507 start_codon:yes stop_codon:yes gene_type:complete
MGNKLGKMVISLKNQIVLFIMFSLLQISFLDAQDIANKKIYKPIIKENEIGKIYSFAGSPDKFVLKKVVKGLPKKRTLTKLRFADESDTYVVKVFGDDNKYLYSIGVGNPFYANATHIGYEDSKVMGGLVNSINLDITLPINIEPTKFVFSKRSKTGILNDIQKIELN